MPQKGLTDAAGTYLTAGELSHREWIASPTWRNAERTDILAQKLDPPIIVAIQVKTRTTGEFQLGMGGEKPALPDSNEWFVLVSLNEVGTRPDFYVVPRDHVAAVVWIGYRAWLATPGRGGRMRNPHTMRAFSAEDFEGYHEAWDLLERPSRKAPWRLEERVWDEAEEFGLPEGHPGLGPRASS